MGLLDDIKKQFGITTVSIGELNRQATNKRPAEQILRAKTDPLEGITITDEYLEVKGLLESGCPLVFVSGKAGTGKSTLIQYLRHSYKNNIVVVAPTGVAALNVQGVTLHSYFQLPPRIVCDSDIKQVRDRRLYTCLDLLIVDEISMVRADMVDAMDAFLRLNGRSHNLPFGGTQMLFIGDLFQLPPVVKKAEEKILDERGYSSPYFFSAKSLAECKAGAIELTKIFRQRDPEFASMLNDIRVAKNLNEVIPRINGSCISKENNSIITLTCTNAVADQINTAEQLKLSGDPKTYHGEIIGKFVVEEERLPAPLNLELKVGAQVMFTKNDEMKRWVNGTLGKVVELLDNNIKVALISEEVHDLVVDVLPVEWESYRYEYDKDADKIVPAVAGSYIQYPLMLAWAVTIHKSQGKTLEKVRVDLGSGAFASGQVYVALSRCRSLADITLARPIKSSEVKCDPVIVRFSQALNP